MPPVSTVDPLRDQLLDAAAEVFARQGYAGTKIQHIVRAAGLSTGAVYGRFGSKDELLREAVTRLSARVPQPSPAIERVADLIRRGAELTATELSAEDAVRLEAFVAARREPEVAAAIGDAQRTWRTALQPLIDAAVADGTVAPGVDPEAVVFFVRTMHLGLLLQRGAGLAGPDASSWDALISRIVASFGDPSSGDITE